MSLWQSAEAHFESFWQGKGKYAYRFGDTFFAEVKSSQDEVSFSLNNIQKGQWQAAIQITSAGGKYFFFIRREIRGDWFRVPAQVVIETFKIKKSMKWTELITYKWEPI